jgi:serine/threonine protein kinase
MVSALHHLHASNVIHRDVKPDNFLVGGVGLSTVKICDFGLAAILPSRGKLCGVVGTTPYMCPEMFLGEWYNEGADIWSLAVTVYVFLFGSFPYVPKDSTKEGMVKAIVKGRPPKFESASQRKILYSPSAMSFVTKLLQRDPAARPSAEEALKFPYIACAMVSRHKTSALALPSLRPMLETARKSGAITPYDLSRRTEIDDLLSIVQFKQLGLRMPDAWKSSQVSNEEKHMSKQNTSATLSTISEITSCSTDAPDDTPDSSLDSSPKSRYLSL